MQELLEPYASKIVLKGDVRGQVWSRVKGARSLSVIQAGRECVLKHPVSAGFWGVEATSCTIAGTVNAVLEKQVDLSDNAGDVDAGGVAHAAAVIGGSLKAGELVLGDLSSADGVVVVCITAG
jgi:hypothetical protein